MSGAILPGATLGVLGGGQLGRMLGQAARRMGYGFSVFTDRPDSCAGHVATREVVAPYDDLDAVARFARDVAVVTYEFENVPAATAEAAARHAPLRPGRELLHAAQERGREKAALARMGLPVPVHAVIDDASGLDEAATTVGFPSILKTAAWGYDGKGQRRVADAAGLRAAFDELGGGRAVLERLVDFRAELSVIVARGVDGSVAVYEPFLNDHSQHILDVTVVPAGLPASTVAQAEEIAHTVVQGFDVVGLLCVELFLLPDDSLFVNEIAPRPHNSGHVTLDAHVTSQFEQQLRAVCGLPLGSTERHVPAAAMANLLGDLWSAGEPDWARCLGDGGVHLHLYGKGEARPGRKLGHLNVADATAAEAEARVRAARDALVGR